jgi:hypothetical protein
VTEGDPRVRRRPAAPLVASKRGLPFWGVSVHWVVPAPSADSAPAVLKLSFPENKGFNTEAAALEVFDGRGIQEFLRVDLEAGTSLLPDLLVCGQCGRP